jgi:hypothetical protein
MPATVDACMVNVKDLEPRRLYRIRSRNLKVAVWTGSEFLGLRNKFWHLRLDEEYAHEEAGIFRTVSAAEPLPHWLPEEIPLVRAFPAVDQDTGRAVDFDLPIADGGRGWFFLDTDEASEAIRPVSYQNQELFDFLRALELSMGIDQLAGCPRRQDR